MGRVRQRTMADACVDTMGTLNIGQAANPGPAGAGALRWVSTMAASALSYASPCKIGFHGSHTAGHFQADGPPLEPFVLRMATASTTGWRPLQAFLRTTDANVVFAQEHRLMPDAVPAASAWARKKDGSPCGRRQRREAEEAPVRGRLSLQRPLWAFATQTKVEQSWRRGMLSLPLWNLPRAVPSWVTRRISTTPRASAGPTWR